MTVKIFSKKKDGNVKLSDNFKVKEFACNDGSDTILIDLELVKILQKIRNYFGKPVNINSGYRTSNYNAKVGGVKNSYHCKGQAVDIKINGIHPVLVALYAESLKVGGIGVYKNFTHVDTRTNKSRWVDGV